MKCRFGFVSNSSSSSFIVELKKDFDVDKPDSLAKGRHSKEQKKILSLLADMVRSDNALQVNEWIDKTFNSCKQSVSIAPWNKDLSIEDVLMAESNDPCSEANMLKPITKWNLDNTYVFSVGRYSEYNENVWICNSDNAKTSISLYENPKLIDELFDKVSR